MLEKTRDKALMKTNLMLMMQWQIDRQASNLQARSGNNEDPELAEDLNFLVNAFGAKLEDVRFCPNVTPFRLQ